MIKSEALKLIDGPMTSVVTPPDVPFYVYFMEWPSNWIYSHISYPLAFVLVLGFFCGHVLWPLFYNLFTRASNKEEFVSRRRAIEIRRAKFYYFKLLGRAFHKWNGSDKPQTINEFVDSLNYPAWLTGAETRLDDKIRSKIGNPPQWPWTFFFEFYKDFYGVMYHGEEGHLLSEKEFDQFHLIQQDLTYFWDEVAQKVLDGSLRYSDIIDDMHDDMRVIKSLCFLDVALYVANKRDAQIKIPLYRLAHRYFWEES